MRIELLPHFSSNAHETRHIVIGLRMKMCKTLFECVGKCVAMVTAYYSNKSVKSCRSNHFFIFRAMLIKCGTNMGAGVLITFSDISSYVRSTVWVQSCLCDCGFSIQVAFLFHSSSDCRITSEVLCIVSITICISYRLSCNFASSEGTVWN